MNSARERLAGTKHVTMTDLRAKVFGPDVRGARVYDQIFQRNGSQAKSAVALSSVQHGSQPCEFQAKHRCLIFDSMHVANTQTIVKYDGEISPQRRLVADRKITP